MKTIVAATIVIFAVILGLGFYVNSTKEKPADIDPTTVLQVKDNDHVVGDPYSSVVLVEYLDIECPACAAYHPVINQIKEANKENIAVVTRHFPLHFHLNARAAAYAAEAAGQQGKFEEMLDKQFAGQQTWSRAGAAAAETIFEQYATELELDIAAFREYRDSDAARNKVEEDINGGIAAGVNSTPSFFLQGEKMNNPRSIEDFQTLIDAELVKVAN